MNVSMNNKNCLISECSAVGQAGTQEWLLKWAAAPLWRGEKNIENTFILSLKLAKMLQN